jgi:hypothetical protein
MALSQPRHPQLCQPASTAQGQGQILTDGGTFLTRWALLGLSDWLHPHLFHFLFAIQQCHLVAILHSYSLQFS